jgi:hypothetical protein
LASGPFFAPPPMGVEVAAGRACVDVEAPTVDIEADVVRTGVCADEAPALPP